MRAATVVGLVAAGLLLPAPALAGERMQLACGGGLVIERTNGASWWEVDGDRHFTAQYLLIEEDGETVYEKSYGHEGKAHVLCEADHFDSRWTVQLVPTR